MSADQKLKEASAKFEQLQREDEQRVRKSGWLSKQGGGKRRANWKKRWFTLQLSKLSYFTDEGDKGKLKGTIDIVFDLSNRVAPSDHKDHCFFVTRDNARTFFLVARDDGERNEWIKAVQECFLIKQEQHERLLKEGGVRASVVVAPTTLAAATMQDPYDANIVRHEGWLEKKGGGKTRANWTKRWFVCRLNGISYYTDQKKTTLKGVIPVDDTITVNTSAAKLFAMSISVPGRIFLLDAHSEPERNTWLAVIQECIKLHEEKKRLKISPASAALSSSSSSPLPPPPSLSLPPPSSLSTPPPPPTLSSPPPAAMLPPPSLAAQPAPPPAGPITLMVSTSTSTSTPLRPPSAVQAAPVAAAAAAVVAARAQPAPAAAPAPAESASKLEQLDTDGLCAWLAMRGVHAAAIETFKDNSMTGKDLLDLTESELKEDLCLDADTTRLILTKVEEEKTGGAAPPSPTTWTTERCVEWLREVGCELAIATFVENELTGADLFELSQAEITDELGIPDEADTPQRLWKQLCVLKLRHTPVQPGLDY